MTDSPDVPPSANLPPLPESYPYTPRWVMLALVVAFALIGYLFYALYQQRQQTSQAFEAATKRASVLSAQLDKTNAAIGDLKAELQVTSQKLGLTEDELARARRDGSSPPQGAKRSTGQRRKTPPANRPGATTNFHSDWTGFRCAQWH